MKTKATALETAYKNGDLNTAETNETNDLATMTAAKKKVDSTFSQSLDYLQKKAKVDKE